MLRLRKNGRAKRNILFKYARWSSYGEGQRPGPWVVRYASGTVENRTYTAEGGSPSDRELSEAASEMEETAESDDAITSDFVGSVRCTAPPGKGMFTRVAVELDEGNRIFTTLPVVPVEVEITSRE